MEYLKYFYEISKLNRCSKKYDEFKKYILLFTKRYNYNCYIDKANNILVKKQNSKSTICLQSHYDIVCLKDNQIPKIVIENDLIKTDKSTTLGADNGIGCSYMLSLIANGYDLEFLFTSDEEIGLVGANNIDLDIQSTYMINLDSEDDKNICVGCAGGIDIIASKKDKKIGNFSDYFLYEVNFLDYPGGHSGVDIDKNIKNAIIELINFINEHSGIVLDINGGERINSIPKNVKAIVAIDKKIDDKKAIFLDNANHISYFDNNIFKFLSNFKNGVLEKNQLGIISSINLAKISSSVDSLDIEFSARSNDDLKLLDIANGLKNNLLSLGFEVKLKNHYKPWQIDTGDFSKKALDIFQKYNKNANFYTIHAGLECAILKNRFKNIKEIISIGPNIYYPHSTNEYTEINSCNKIFNILKDIVKLPNNH